MSAQLQESYPALGVDKKRIVGLRNVCLMQGIMVLSRNPQSPTDGVNALQPESDNTPSA